MAFVYDVELLPGQNPPGAYDRVREGLRAFFEARGLDYGMGAQGGSRHCYGQVTAPDLPSAEDARRAIVESVRGLRVRGVVRLGPVVPAEPPPPLLGPITDTVIEVDTLTEADRAAAAAWHAGLRRRIAPSSRRPADPGPGGNGEAPP